MKASTLDVFRQFFYFLLYFGLITHISVKVIFQCIYYKLFIDDFVLQINRNLKEIFRKRKRKKKQKNNDIKISREYFTSIKKDMF